MHSEHFGLSPLLLLGTLDLYILHYGYVEFDFGFVYFFLHRKKEYPKISVWLMQVKLELLQSMLSLTR